MSDEFIKSLAEIRAKELFTREFFETCTDSWYGDEVFRFKDFKVGKESRKPTEKEVDKYMGWLQKLKDIYQDNFYDIENVVSAYGYIIDKLRNVLNGIEECKKRYKKFECSDDITLKLKQIGNYFVELYNTELPVYNDKVRKNEK